MNIKLSKEEADTLREYLDDTINSTLTFLREGSNEVIDKDIKNLRAVYYQLLVHREYGDITYHSE